MDELLATMQAQLDADADRWFVEDTPDTWCLYRGVYQIIKAPKHSTPFAEYWPNAEDTAFILAALNGWAAVTVERDALQTQLEAADQRIDQLQDEVHEL